jgi:hypothetical protein
MRSSALNRNRPDSGPQISAGGGYWGAKFCTTEECQMTQLHAQLETVNDEATFLAFAQALAIDRRSDAEHWESGSIEDFLESACACAWAEDSGFGSKQGLSAASPWRKLATFLYCGKIYE